MTQGLVLTVLYIAIFQTHFHT